MRPQSENPPVKFPTGKPSQPHLPKTITFPAALPVPQPSVCTGSRPLVGGKFLRVGEEKLYVRVVTYRPFPPDPRGSPYPAPGVVEWDFSQMRGNGINSVRTYDVPPLWLMDLAQKVPTPHDGRARSGALWPFPGRQERYPRN
jgi:hypothetical protein